MEETAAAEWLHNNGGWMDGFELGGWRQVRMMAVFFLFYVDSLVTFTRTFQPGYGLQLSCQTVVHLDLTVL